MILNFDAKHSYNLIDETKIETQCGALYRAMDLTLGRNAAVKVIRIQGQDSRQRQVNYQKAMNEVRSLVAMESEGVCVPRVYQVYYDQKAGVLYIIMEWIQGTELTQKMQVPEVTFLRWMIDLCDILAAMDRKHLYHKDIKPANIMITNTGKLVLIDFNISAGVPNLVEGSRNYRAPEMMPDSEYTGREKVDMFAIGVMLYEYYTGAVPVHTVDYARNSSFGPLRWDHFVMPNEKTPGISNTVNDLICRCMALDPKSRYGRIGDLKYELGKAVREANAGRKN